MTATHREYAEAIWQQTESLEAANSLLEVQSADRYLFTGLGLRHVMHEVIRAAQELVRLEAEYGLRGAVDRGTYRSPLKSEAGLKDMINAVKK